MLVSAGLNATGAPARLIRCADRGLFEPVVSPALLREYDGVLERPKIGELLPPTDASALRKDLLRLATVLPDAGQPPSIESPDPSDDFLLALVERERLPLVTGDRALLKLADRIPVFSPAEFLELLTARD